MGHNTTKPIGWVLCGETVNPLKGLSIRNRQIIVLIQ